MKQMNRTLNNGHDSGAMKEAMRLENEINATFRKLKDQNIQALNSKAYDYGVGSTFGDVVQEMERLGDYVINVVQVRMGQ